MHPRPLRYNRQVDKGGQTVSATEFAELTGVSRERLRTWERRFDFPRPARVAHGPRRYALADATPRRRRATRGRAGRAAAARDRRRRPGRRPPPSVRTARWRTSPTVAPTPVCSSRARSRCGSSTPTRSAAMPTRRHGQLLDALLWFSGSDLERTLHTLSRATRPRSKCATRRGPAAAMIERSIAYRLPARTGEPPTVALVRVDRAAGPACATRTGRTAQELTRVRVREQRRRSAGWRSPPRSPSASSARPATRPRLDGRHARATARRGRRRDRGLHGRRARARHDPAAACWGPRMVPVTALRRPRGADAASEPAGSPPPRAARSARPGAARPRGPDHRRRRDARVLLLVFDEPTELDDDARRLLTIVSAGLGFTILRDRLVSAARDEADTGAGET